MAKAAGQSRKGKGAGIVVKTPKARAPSKAKAGKDRSAKDFMLVGSSDPQSPPWLVTEQDVTKTRPKRPGKAKVMRRSVPRPRSGEDAVAAVFTPMPDTTIGSAPLSRAQAPVLWQKAGPLDHVLAWFRSGGRSMAKMLRRDRTQYPRTKAPIGAKLRTKNDLLREMAVLRQENAMLRKRLGLPQMPFGRHIGDIV